MADNALFVWTESMNIGIPVIDGQHRLLMELINRLYLSVVRRESQTATSQILDELIDYTRVHFTLEEQLLEEVGYEATDLEQHRQVHRHFVERIEQAAERHLGEGKSVSFELISLLKHWLKEHILITDRRYADALRAAGVLTADGVLHVDGVEIAETLGDQPAPGQAIAAANDAGRAWWKIWHFPLRSRAR